MPPYTYLNRSAAVALYHALIAEDPFYITLENAASGPQPREAMFRYMDYSMTEAENHGKLLLTPDKASGAAIWSLPMPREKAATLSQAKKAFLRDHLGKASLETYTRIIDFMGKESEGVLPDPIWYLSILGVDPARQGQGLGGELVRPVLAEADARGVATYIESFTPSNFGFYERLGFRIMKTVDEPETRSRYAIMIREARTP